LPLAREVTSRAAMSTVMGLARCRACRDDRRLGNLRDRRKKTRHWERGHATAAGWGSRRRHLLEPVRYREG
jgi:hypothetical protein